jgi:hypothetical protein
MPETDKALAVLQEYGRAERREGYLEGLADMYNRLMTQGVHAYHELLNGLEAETLKPQTSEAMEAEEPEIAAAEEPELAEQRQRLVHQLAQRRQQLAQTAPRHWLQRALPARS